jgi:hypothetical protein
LPWLRALVGLWLDILDHFPALEPFTHVDPVRPGGVQTAPAFARSRRPVISHKVIASVGRPGPPAKGYSKF